MKISRLLKVGQKSLARIALVNQGNSPQRNAGFTIIELLIVIILVGTLSAIAVPGWLGFINNQRLRTSRGQVYGALQLAQSNAKRDKVAWQASFRTQGSLVQWAIHPATVVPDTLPVSTSSSSAPNIWYSLEDKVAIATGSETNLQQPVTDTYIAIFNRQGCLVDNAANECTDAVAATFTLPQRITLKHDQLGSARRCAVVETLLGAMRTGDDATNCTP